MFLEVKVERVASMQTKENVPRQCNQGNKTKLTIQKVFSRVLIETNERIVIYMLDFVFFLNEYIDVKEKK